jgi:hypothetical protein
MSEKRFKVGDTVKVVLGASKGVTGTVYSYGMHHDYYVKFDKVKMASLVAFYDDCDLEAADAVAGTGMVKVEIEVPVIPADKIPAGRKLGNPMAKYQVAYNQNVFLDTSSNTWEICQGPSEHRYRFVANFVPIEPEEPEFVDREIQIGTASHNYYVNVVGECGNRTLSDAASQIEFVEYLWKDADGKIKLRSMERFRYAIYGVCTHVRFINPKYKKGE